MCRLGLDREPGKTFAITDPELILHAYHRWGSECVDHLLGDFALAIWDGKRRQLFCARDHFGVKPFYYVHTGDTLLIGNTLEILRRHPGVTGSIDEIAVADFLLFGSNMHHERTAFEEIRKLPPASILTWSPGNGLQRRRYWRLPVPEPLRRKRSKDTIDQFLDLMRTAVGDRMRTGNIGLSLSGGMDSTTVAAMAAEYRDTRPGTYDLRACTVYDGRWIKDDEHRFSKVAADALDIPVRAVNTANDQLSVKRDTMRRWTMAPLSEPVTAASNIELKALSRGCRVVLTGQGGDPVLDPSPLHAGAFFKSVIFDGLGWEILRHRFTHQSFPRIGIRKSLRRWIGVHPARKRDLYPPWFNPRFQKRFHLEQRWVRYHQVKAPVNSTRSGAHRHLEGRVWTSLFEELDAGGTGEGVEFRHPFFDLRVVSFLTALPAVPSCVDKMILRRSMASRLPETILRRPKTPLSGFAIYEQLVQTPLTGVKEILKQTDLDNYIDRRLLLKLLAHPEKLYPEEYT